MLQSDSKLQDWDLIAEDTELIEEWNSLGTGAKKKPEKYSGVKPLMNGMNASEQRMFGKQSNSDLGFKESKDTVDDSMA